jgi:4-amino-4-deoxy-L-arabinose transferase-like glycosyltransferase
LLLTSDFSLQNARIPMALLALLSLLGVYVLARELTSAPKAAWAILLLAATPQWSVYGAQLLGEVPMLGALCLGLWGLVRLLWQRGSLPWNGLLAWVGFSVAVLCKAYVLLPIGLVLLCVCAWAVVQRRQLVLAVLLVGMGVGVAVALHWALRFQSWGVFSAFWQQNTAYTSAEFVALHTATAAGFLLTKPILLLGTLALLVRGSIQRVAAIRVTALLQALLLLLFLVSAGYDRFGLWLAPLACVFFAEWVVAVWRRIDVPWQRHRRMKLVTWASVILLLAWQRTLWLPRWWPEPNLAERQMALQLANATEPIGTLELALVPFLSSNAHVLLPAITPAAARQQPTALQLPPSARFIAGPYYHTEYRPRMGARTVLCGTKPLPGSLPDSQHPYTLFQCR